jgi:hypothetical protein
MQLSVDTRSIDLIKQDEESKYKQLEQKFMDNENKLVNIGNKLQKLLVKVDMQKLM